MNMRLAELPIDHVEIFHVGIPLAGDGFRNAYALNTAQHSIVARVKSGDAVGLGNVDPLPGYSAESLTHVLAALRTVLGPALVGQDAGNLHAIATCMNARLTGHLEAKAALEMACLDLLANTLGIAVHQLLGGAVRQRVHVNAWIGIVPPDQAACEAVRWQAAGFQSAKIKLGGDIYADRDRVQAVRNAVGDDMALRGDANAGYSVKDSIALGRLLESCQLQLLEQPVAAEDLAGLAKVRQAIDIPIMADEAVTDHHSLIDVIRTHSADIVKLKVMKQGGLLACRRMMETASAAGLQIVLGHGFGLDISTRAELMLAATSLDVIDGLECVGPLKMQDDITTHRLDLSAGSLDVPDGPGLGAVIDEDQLRRYEVLN